MHPQARDTGFPVNCISLYQWLVDINWGGNATALRAVDSSHTGIPCHIRAMGTDGALGAIRTPDPRIRSPLLCPLSYEGMSNNLF